MKVTRKSEVNIFNASVVDLFASAMGVFLVFAIYFMTKAKEVPVDQSEKQEQVMAGKSEFKVGSTTTLKNITFYSGTDKPINPYSRLALEEVAMKLMNSNIKKIEVVGHIYISKNAFEQGKADEGYGVTLSMQRAKRVCSLLKKMNIPQECLYRGEGGRFPLSLTNDWASEAAQLNRRVELNFIK